MLSFLTFIVSQCLQYQWETLSEIVMIIVLRQIRDEPNRLCRKTSILPDEAFIVEEVLLEDLCALSGEEAREGGNIIL